MQTDGDSAGAPFTTGDTQCYARFDGLIECTKFLADSVKRKNLREEYHPSLVRSD